jgi:hypothetical protein
VFTHAELDAPAEDPLVAMLWRRQTAAALTPGCSASITSAYFSAMVKLPRLDRPSRAAAALAMSVKPFSTDTRSPAFVRR